MDLFLVLSCAMEVFKILANKFGVWQALAVVIGSIDRTHLIYKDSPWEKPNDAVAEFVKSITLSPPFICN